MLVAGTREFAEHYWEHRDKTPPKNHKMFIWYAPGTGDHGVVLSAVNQEELKEKAGA